MVGRSLSRRRIIVRDNPRISSPKGVLSSFPPLSLQFRQVTPGCSLPPYFLALARYELDCTCKNANYDMGATQFLSLLLPV